MSSDSTVPVCPTCRKPLDLRESFRVYHYWGPLKESVSLGPYLFLYEAMKKLPGIDCFHFECHGRSDMFGTADAHIEVDWSPELHGIGEFPLPSPSLYWCWDHHLSDKSLVARVRHASSVDFVCTIHENSESLKSGLNGKPVIWVPQAAEPTLWKPMEGIEERFDVGFIGEYYRNEDRIEALDSICRAFPSSCVTMGYWGEHGARKLHEFRIAFNYSAFPERVNTTNLRTFEAMSAGRAVVTNLTGDLEVMGFVNGKHLMAYRNADEAADMVQWLLDHPEERKAMGLAARERILDGHTFVHRAIKVLELVGKPIHLEPEKLMELITMDPWDVPSRPLWQNATVRQTA